MFQIYQLYKNYIYVRQNIVNRCKKEPRKHIFARYYYYVAFSLSC